MSKKAQLSVVGPACQRGDPVTLQLQILDPKLLGCQAKLTVYAKVQVKDERPVHEEKQLYQTTFSIQQTLQSIQIPAKATAYYSYTGKNIDIITSARVVIDDAIFFDTKLNVTIPITYKPRPASSHQAEQLINPPDRRSFMQNLRAIPAANRSKVYYYLLIGGTLILTMWIVAMHDLFSSSEQAWLYTLSDDDRVVLIAILTLIVSVLLWWLFWFLIRKQLQSYLIVSLRPLSKPIGRNLRYRVSDLLQGKAVVPIQNLQIRIVASNMEKGQYKRGSGTRERTVSFQVPVQGVMLFHKAIPYFPAGASLAGYLEDDIDFTPVFDTLYAPLDFSNSHGLDIHWEIQLLHHQFVDHELVCPGKAFRREDF